MIGQWSEIYIQKLSSPFRGPNYVPDQIYLTKSRTMGRTKTTDQGLDQLRKRYTSKWSKTAVT